MAPYDALVIGGGFYGATLALQLAQTGQRVALLEKETRLLRGASHTNQARVHQGYHYPRAILTALRSQAHYNKFLADYADCVETTIPAYYAVARQGSKVTAAQFQLFCKRIHAPLTPAPARVKKWFDPQTIEEVWGVSEALFNAEKLTQRLSAELERAAVAVQVQTAAERITLKSGELIVQTPTQEMAAKRVYLCAYARMNSVLERSGLPTIALKQEVTEMALVRLPNELKDVGITVMCGPFFSVLPFPMKAGCHSLSHVRYTPHAAWQEGLGKPTPSFPLVWPATHFPHMVKDAARYVPLLAQAHYQESLWEIKAVLPVSETDDSRPILYLRDHGVPGLTCILGGKIDNVYDMHREVERG